MVTALAQGQVWWAELPTPTGSGRGYRRPVIVVQGNSFNRSRIATVVVVPLTRTLRLAEAPGNLLLRAEDTGLSNDSIANVSQVVTVAEASFRYLLLAAGVREDRTAGFGNAD